MNAKILYNRKEIAALIGVTPTQLRCWKKHPNLFTLPPNGGKPIHRHDLLAALNRVHHGGCKLLAVPEGMMSQKELLAYYGVSRTVLPSWKADGLPCFVFSKRMLRYVLKEVEMWYLNTYGSRRSMQQASSA